MVCGLCAACAVPLRCNCRYAHAAAALSLSNIAVHRQRAQPLVNVRVSTLALGDASNARARSQPPTHFQHRTQTLSLPAARR